MAFSEEGRPWGSILHTQGWARSREVRSRREKQAVKNSKALDERESQRWSQAYEAVVRQVQERQASSPKEPQPRLVMVADREGDIYELFCSNAAHDGRCALLVRALHARRLEETGQVVWSHLEAQPEVGRIELEVPEQGSRPARLATLSLRSARVKLGVPRDKARLFKATEPLDLWAIEAREIQSGDQDQEAGEPLHWKLLSSTPAPDSLSVQRQLKWYARRWGIEVYHRTLKSGCRSERRQLRTLERLQCALSLDSIVAWRLMALRDAARKSPQAEAAQWLEPAECEVLRAWRTHQGGGKKQPQTVLTIQEAVRWIARLGGYMDRKNDPPPGTQVIWRGLHHLHDMTQTWLLAKLVGNS